MTTALEGIRIIDFTGGQAAPYATTLLGDLGADVIHVEDKDHGDRTRWITHWFSAPIQLPKGQGTPMFQEHNRNKKSLGLDFKKPQARDIFYRLVEHSDFFVSNYRVSALKRLGLAYEDLEPLNPRLIYAIVSGLGPEGPDADEPIMDGAAHARSGMMMNGGEEGMGPIIMPPGSADRATAITLAYGLLAALVARERTGKGQRVDLSLLSALMSLQGNNICTALMLGSDLPRFRRDNAYNPLYNIYECKDHKYLMFSCLNSTRYWPRLCRALGMPELVEDPRFQSEEARAEHREELIAFLKNMMLTKTRDEWKALFRGKDLMIQSIQTITELVEDPQVIANDYVIDCDHPALGPIKFIGFPVRFSDTPARIYAFAPELGAHTETILTEVCGYSWDQLRDLTAQGVI